MSGALAAAILSGGAGVEDVRDPETGDYFDADYRVTQSYWVASPPITPDTWQVVFRWGGVDVYTYGPYPVAPPTSVTVGDYTYYTGDFESSSGSFPVVSLSGIYREGPPV